MGGGDVNYQNADIELDISASHSPCILIGQLKRKPSESCQKLCRSSLQDYKEVKEQVVFLANLVVVPVEFLNRTGILKTTVINI